MFNINGCSYRCRKSVDGLYDTTIKDLEKGTRS